MQNVSLFVPNEYHLYIIVNQLSLVGYLGILITINLVLLGFKDNLLAQNHSYNLFSYMFAISC